MQTCIVFLVVTVSMSTTVAGFQVAPTGRSPLASPLLRNRHSTSRLYDATDKKDDQWDDSPEEPKDDLGFFDSIKAYFKSEEGRVKQCSKEFNISTLPLPAILGGGTAIYSVSVHVPYL